GLRFSPFISASTGRPFNITTGRDLNGDGLFNDRPAFATDPSRSVRTPWGDFDPNPLPGEVIIPRNYGQGPGQFSVNLRISRTFSLGAKAEATRADQSGGQSAFGGARGPGGDRGGRGGPGGGGGYRGGGGGRGGRGGGGPGGMFGGSNGGKKYNLSLSVS